MAMAKLRSPSYASVPPHYPAFNSSSISRIHFHILASHIHSTNKRVSVFWDLDNKPPKFPPFQAALHLRATAALFGTVFDSIVYANLHAFHHIPSWLANNDTSQTQPRQIGPSSTRFFCSLCGFSCETKLQLKKHRKSFHNGEKGPKKIPFAGYGLGLELARAGFRVRIVDQGPQAADRALKRQMKHAMESGTQCICLVSDDSGFSEILRKAKEKGVMTVVIGDTVSLKMFADLWFLWDDVAEGKCVSDDITQSIDAEGKCVSDDITQSIDAEGKCVCDDITQSIDAEGKCVSDDITQSIDAEGKCVSDDITQSIDAEGKCVSDDITQSIDAEGELMQRDGQRKNSCKYDKYKTFYDFSLDFSSPESEDEEEEDFGEYEEQ